jgi:phosphotransferase system enzyme I (PtsI)
MIGVENIFKYVNENDMVVIDAVNDVIVINPPKNEIESFKKRQSLFEKKKREMLKGVDLPATTKDGHKISLVANIELVEEIPSAILHGAEGVGLFRTEYLFVNRMDYPDEEEQFKCYKNALEGMKNKPVTIRTMDLGGDKLFIGSEYVDHVNPALGLRAIRFCLVEKDIFRTQLRAMLRASVYGRLRMLLPMVSGLDELRRCKKFIQDVKGELTKEKVKISDDIELGIMIEVPSAVVVARILANEVDFFSIGTNDLIQYTLAVDRTNEHVAHLYNPLDPAVINMLKQTIEAAKMAGIDVTICGEVAGEPLYLPLFLGMGIDALSMNSISIPKVKKILREVTYEDAKKFFSKIEKMTSATEIEAVVKGEMSKYSKILERSK